MRHPEIGQLAVELASALNDPLVTGPGAAALSKELRDVMAVVSGGHPGDDHLVDELRRRHANFAACGEHSVTRPDGASSSAWQSD
jgi:hypothetical protein